jgi:hypothetical protein
LTELKINFNITAGNYWDRHYVPDECSAFKKKKPGLQMTESLLINTAVPLLFAYGRLRKEPAYSDKALQWLSSMKPERNVITRHWNGLGIGSINAASSHALLEFKTHYCDPKKCLECAIGNSLLSYQG